MVRAAASARLCVETRVHFLHADPTFKQPPPRGCVLKQRDQKNDIANKMQPPPRGCVLKLFVNN